MQTRIRAANGSGQNNMNYQEVGLPRDGLGFNAWCTPRSLDELRGVPSQRFEKRRAFERNPRHSNTHSIIATPAEGRAHT